MNLKGKKIVIIGFGKSGKAATKLLLNQEPKEIIVSESMDKSQIPLETLKFFESQGVYFETGGHKKETLLSSDLIVVSPGVPREIYQICIKKGIPVLSELELAWQLLPEPKKSEVIAITGTNGKTTTTAIVSELLKLSGYKVFTGGNYGIPLSELVISNTPVEKIVLEISSFQLENIHTFYPKIGILLNIAPDHLERYTSEEEYAYYKYKIFENQKNENDSILPFQEKWFDKFKKMVKGKLNFFDEKENLKAKAFIKNEGFVLNLQTQEFYSFYGFKLLGIHNKINFMVASLGARLGGATQESIRTLIPQFTGFPHRLEYIGEFNGIYFINDSKATNVSATISALKSLPGCSIILILGGKHKGGSYADLIPYIKEKVKTLILMGDSRFILAEELKDLTETHITENLKDATLLAIKSAKPGDIVLLSPACSSFDQFKNYEERGNYFRNLVLTYTNIYLDERKRGVLH